MHNNWSQQGAPFLCTDSSEWQSDKLHSQEESLAALAAPVRPQLPCRHSRLCCTLGACALSRAGANARFRDARLRSRCSRARGVSSCRE
eukprot:6209721-Pleurochrysis_carterae.AAC.1